MSRYEENRAKVPPAELEKYAGRWVAFSMDGSRVLASAATLPELEKHLTDRGHDPQRVALERIEREDSTLGGAELL